MTLLTYAYTLTNHNNLSCSTCLDCLSKGVRFTHYRSLAQLRPVIQMRCSRLGQLWVTHWNTLETCRHCVWVPADSIMGGSMDGWVEEGQKPETVALSFFLLWTGAMALVKQVWAWVTLSMGQNYTLPIFLIFSLSFHFLYPAHTFWSIYWPPYTVLGDRFLMPNVSFACITTLLLWPDVLPMFKRPTQWMLICHSSPLCWKWKTTTSNVWLQNYRNKLCPTNLFSC